jgi:hypothetical protein
MYCGTYEQAKKQALANAKTFQTMYIIFSSGIGRWHCERWDKTERCSFPGENTVTYPDGRIIEQ